MGRVTTFDLLSLDQSHVEAAAEMMGRAFWDYPIPARHLPDESERARCFPHLYRSTVKMTIKYGEAYATSSAFEGVIMWLPPGNAYLSMWQSLRTAPGATIGFYRNGGRKILAGAAFQAVMQRRNAPMDHWTLGPIAVDPAHRGRGFASRLIRPMLERADDGGVPVYLSSNTEENIALYEHFGFKVKERADMPGVDGWNASMLREPQ